ncbi:hypothetical protein HLY00_1163 [Mycolicibacterium hippocampi]|uniref:Uncharacterized protein n=1 Tax=Mycolicibacterium hippocampi TaxID=659824 RepID=A0A850PQW7_9MYCO|nr:hypothetical protein [Mycolicibacterium hippocampi]
MPPNLSVLQLPHEPVQQLAQRVDRRVSAQVMVIEGQVMSSVIAVRITAAQPLTTAPSFPTARPAAP